MLPAACCIALCKEQIKLFRSDIENTASETSKLLTEYATVAQITAPDEQWVLERLERSRKCRNWQAVTKDNDPNGLLGKEGGYSSCVYFTIFDIDLDSIPGSDVIEKGTDAGGAIEVYSKLDDAKKRCEYLSQFDDTLLYSGSYTLVGTMVIRTSYKLSNQQQVELTEAIIQEFTKG